MVAIQLGLLEISWDERALEFKEWHESLRIGIERRSGGEGMKLT